MQVIASTLRWIGLPIAWFALGIFSIVTIIATTTSLLLVSPLLVFGVGLVSIADEIDSANSIHK
jgi:hypothetical protein